MRDAPGYMATVLHEFLIRKTKDEAAAGKLKDLMPTIERESQERACHAFTKWTVVERSQSGR